ncbi:MAG: prevent-host-death protein [Cyanobacteria bacterium J06638_20]
MQNYSLDNIGQVPEDVLEQAKHRPVVLMENAHPSYVLMSAEAYRSLLRRLEEAENQVWGELAEKAVDSASMVGSDRFVAELKQLAALEEA